ncbi:MAG: 3-deoxy-D-manno-octulosonic acid transferase [wastewater metagenome]|nr:3-deoxy-D-manno-octulosonic acid transferase [Candidatus Loosdrechtia aerotolerans]
MSAIFNIIYITALTFSSPYLLLKILTNKRYRSGIPQRLGWITVRERKSPCMWIHCASVGEVLTIKTLVKHLEKEFNTWDIVLSTNTNTGLFVAQKNFPGRKVFYLPLDFSWIIDKVLNAIAPNCLILIELELWPNFIMAAAKRNIPVILLNARISEKSLKWYRILSKISERFFESITRKGNFFCARTSGDADRLKNWGIPEEQMVITGNMKFDTIITTLPKETEVQLTQVFEIDKQDKIIVCGSTHEGEEIILLRTFQHIRKKFNTLRFILVPRHIERVNDIITVIESLGLKHVKKTSLDKGEGTIDRQKYETVILVDTVGDLLATYSIADCVFVGKSLVPKGGQNILEPAGLAKPIIIGPYTFNFHEEVQLLKEADAIKIVQDESSLSNEMMYVLEHPVEAQNMGKRAQAAVRKQRGATDRNVRIIREILLKEKVVFI